MASITIHPNASTPLAVDIRDILAALSPLLNRWKWCVRDLDWLGDDSDVACRAVEAARPRGCWFSSNELVQRSQTIHQTIEGEFWAFPRSIDVNTLSEEDMNLLAFDASRADLAIVAVDGGSFDIYTKNADHLDALRELRGGRVQDLSSQLN